MGRWEGRWANISRHKEGMGAPTLHHPDAHVSSDDTAPLQFRVGTWPNQPLSSGVGEGRPRSEAQNWAELGLRG